MLVMSASVRTPAAMPIATSDSASRRESSFVFMNAPAPVFTSRTSPPMPSAIFLLMIDAQMSGMLSTVPVTSRKRVELAVRRRDLRGLTDQRAADRRDRRSQLVQRQPRAEAGNRFELVEGAARVAETAARHHRHVAHRTPRPAARGRATSCRRHRRCCACRPAMPGSPGYVTRTPDRTMASVSAAVSSGVIPRSRIAISSADAW